MFMVPIVAILSVSIVLAAYLNARIETCLITVMSLIMLVLVASVPFHALSPATYTIAGAACLATPYAILLAIRHRRLSKSLIRLSIPVAVIIVYAVARQDYSFYLWDDIGHWARVIKFAGLYDRVMDTTSGWIPNRSYPPGTGLSAYFFVKFFGYSEPNAILAQFILTCLAIAAVVSPVTENSSTLGAVCFFVIVLAAYLFQLSPDELTADMLLGFYLASAVVIALTERSVATITIANAIICSALVLLKPSGILFALLGSSASTVAIFARVLPYRANATSGASDHSLQLDLRYKALCAALVISSVLACYTIWLRFSVGTGGEATSGYLAAGVKEIYQAISRGAFNPRDAKIFAEFGRRLIDGAVAPIPLFGVAREWVIGPLHLTALLFCCSLLIAFVASRRERAATLLTLNVVALGTIPYTLSLFIVYLKFFSGSEALTLASFERYLSSYFLAWTSILVASGFAALARLRPLQLTVAMSLVLAGTLPVLAELEISLARTREYRILNVDSVRVEAKRLAAVVKSDIKPGERIYFVKQGDTGFGIYTFQFEMEDHKTNSDCWSFGRPYSEFDIFTCGADLNDKVQGFDILVLAKADNQFWTRYNHLFAAGEVGVTSGVYRINANSAGDGSSLLFHKIDAE